MSQAERLARRLTPKDEAALAYFVANDQQVQDDARVAAARRLNLGPGQALAVVFIGGVVAVTDLGREVHATLGDGLSSALPSQDEKQT